jgi:trehalose synthase-fused probable maltokinase
MMVDPVPWPALRDAGQRPLLAKVLLEYVRPRRWFRAKGRQPVDAQIVDLVPLDGPGPGQRRGQGDDGDEVLAILRINYASGEPDLYVIPLAEVDGPTAQALAAAGSEAPPAIVTALGPSDVESVVGGSSAAKAALTATGDGALVDGMVVPHHAADIFLRLMRDGRTLRGQMNGQVRGEALPLMAELDNLDLPVAKLPRVEQTNSTAIFGDRVLLKVYRQLTAGPNPELEIGRYLTAHSNPPCAPRVLGALSYRSAEGGEYSLAIAHEYLSNQGDAFTFTRDELRRYFARTAGQQPPPRGAHPTGGAAALLARADGGFETGDRETAASRAVGQFITLAATLGRRTGELHLALAAADPHDPAFAVQPLTAADRAQQADRAEAMLQEEMDALSGVLSQLSPPARGLAERLLSVDGRQNITRTLSQFRQGPIDAAKTRTHGDLHLGQVLVRGDDFVIIDFEGEPARPLSERRAKSSPVRDVMGMVRSFDYAPEVVLRDPAFAQAHAADAAGLQVWAALWKQEVTAAYVGAYLATVKGATFLPTDPRQLALLLTFHEMEKVIYEIGYEVNNRPDWVEIPLRGLATLAAVENAS